MASLRKIVIFLANNAKQIKINFIPTLYTKLKTYKSKIIIIGKNQSQEDASNKLENKPLRDYETAFCSPLAHTVLQKKINKDLLMFLRWPMFDLKIKVKVK
jgi:hypothetical protein